MSKAVTEALQEKIDRYAEQHVTAAAPEETLSADNVLPLYVAHLSVDTLDSQRVLGVQVTGTAEVVDQIITAAVTAFHEDAER